MSAEVSSGGIKQEQGHRRVRTAREHANFHGDRQGAALTFRYMMSDNVPFKPPAAAA